MNISIKATASLLDRHDAAPVDDQPYADDRPNHEMATAVLNPASRIWSRRHRSRRIRASVRDVKCAGAAGAERSCRSRSISRARSSASSQNIRAHLSSVSSRWRSCRLARYKWTSDLRCRRIGSRRLWASAVSSSSSAWPSSLTALEPYDRPTPRPPAVCPEVTTEVKVCRSVSSAIHLRHPYRYSAAAPIHIQ